MSKAFDRSRNTPTVYCFSSKLLDILSTKSISAIYVAYFFLNPYCFSDIMLCFVKKAVEPIVHYTFDYFSEAWKD